MKVLLVCFAGTCRSPVAAALLGRATGARVEVAARGLVGGDGEIPRALAEVLSERGIAIGPVGVVLERAEARASDVNLFMTRELLREAAVGDPAIWPRSFTVREFARRALADPPGGADQGFAQWVAVLHSRRVPADLLGAAREDDVADPGLYADADAYRAMVAELGDLMDRLAPFLLSWSSR